MGVFQIALQPVINPDRRELSWVCEYLPKSRGAHGPKWAGLGWAGPKHTYAHPI